MKLRDEVIIQAVNNLKKNPFGTTAIKVELEAQLNRGDDDSEMCSDCNGNGDYTCNECEGYWEAQCNPDFCENDECEERHDPCDYCDEGRTECDDCGGSGRYGGEEYGEYGNEKTCHDFILERLVEHGLAEPIPEGETYTWANNYRPKLPLAFSKFYRDGSVDSELTFTLMLDNPQNVFLLPKVVEVFNLFMENAGNDVEIDGAGMHMALINDPNGKYIKDQQPPFQRYCMENFSKSMGLLLPALYFLGATNENSRPLGYRKPMVSMNEKYSAIFLGGNALEFRIFDTCYDRPEQILDNVVVMSKCMRYWGIKFKPSGLGRITPKIQFGKDDDFTLARFYNCIDHMDLLNKGLERLKPDYLTIGDIKKQRNFKKTKGSFTDEEKAQRAKAELAYKEYEERFEWQLRKMKAQWIYERFQRTSVVAGLDQSAVVDRIEQEVDSLIDAQRSNKQKLEDYIKDQLNRFNETRLGGYTLAE